ncbi:hypothetical protein OUZ56_028242 [Daphnia magna]|uniref:Uncharacterized protein n=1 Tax=Daphnia magna TaxID=35525 RepID=A0ABR0B3E4_9CRUS|nr:hypothetical protein OUZ56_028242 [Daphnia magna]
MKICETSKVSSLRIVLFIFQHEYTFIGKQISEHEQLANCQNQDNESDDPEVSTTVKSIRLFSFVKVQLGKEYFVFSKGSQSVKTKEADKRWELFRRSRIVETLQLASHPVIKICQSVDSSTSKVFRSQ